MSMRKQVDLLLAQLSEAAYKALDEYDKHGPEIPSLNSTVSHPLDEDEVKQLDLKKHLRILEGASEQLCSTLAPPVHTIFNRAHDYYWACLRVVSQNRIADVLAAYPNGMNVKDLSVHVLINPEKLSQILQLLASKHCFREVEPNVFAHNRLSIILCSENTFSPLLDLVTLEGPQAASSLQPSLKDVEFATSTEPYKSPFLFSLRSSGYEGTFYEWLSSHPDRKSVMGRSMGSMNKVIGTLSVLEVYPWKDFNTICDVGSGIGSFALAILDRFPNMRVILFDLPGTISLAKQMWEKDHLSLMRSGRVEYTSGDFFTEVPVRGLDLYYLRNILHNWPDVQVIQILRTIRRAMSPSSRLLIHDYVLHSSGGAFGSDQAPAPLLPNYGAGQARMYNQNLTMLLIHNSRERTATELASMGSSVGLVLSQIWDLGETAVLEFTPSVS